MMSKGNTRKGYTQAIFNLETGKLFAAELILAAIAIGVYFTSWYGFGAALLTLSIFSYLRSTGFILAIVLSCLWSALAAANACIFQGVNFFQESFNPLFIPPTIHQIYDCSFISNRVSYFFLGVVRDVIGEYSAKIFP